MTIIRNRLAARYARAFIGIQKTPLSEQELEKIKQCEDFLNSNPTILANFLFPGIPQIKKDQALEVIAEYFNLNDHYKNLMHLLLIHKRMQLLTKVLHNIRVIDSVLKNKELFSVSSSHELNDNEKKSIQKFIQKHFPSGTPIKFTIDPSLINGIRILSSNYVWERSIAKQLKLIEQNLHNQGVL